MIGSHFAAGGRVGSRPYLKMTAELMAKFGVRPELKDQQVVVPAGTYQPATYRVEPDWSAASYWFAFTALAEAADILLPGVESKALQGDRVIVDIMNQLGVNADFQKDGLRLTKSSQITDHLVWDFTNCPDLAQTIFPVCAAKNIPGEFTGLESLRIKETDRISALQTELQKLGCTISESNGRWKLTPGHVSEPNHGDGTGSFGMPHGYHHRGSGGGAKILSRVLDGYGGDGICGWPIANGYFRYLKSCPGFTANRTS